MVTRHQREHMRLHAHGSNPFARGKLDLQDCKFPPATLLRSTTLKPNRKRFPVAYGQRRAQPGAQPPYANDSVTSASIRRITVVNFHSYRDSPQTILR